MASRVKKWNVLGALAAVLIVWLLVALFLDTFIKRALISAGQAAAGAKVEIAVLRTSLIKGSFTVSGVAVANKNEPMKNLVEFGKAELKFSPGAALRAKAVVDDAFVSGLRFGTARKTSGALPLTGRSKFEKMLAEQLSPVREEAAASAGEAKDKLKELDPSKLSSRAALEDAQKKVDEISKRAKTSANVEAIEARIKDLEKEKNGLEIARKGQALLADVKKAREGVEKDLGEMKSALARADELRKKDLDGLLAAAGVPRLDAESITRRLIGPIAAQKLSTALYWVRWARLQQAKSQKKKVENPPVVRKGVNVEFPVKNALPAFLLRRAALDGELDGLVPNKALALKGELKGVTSNAPLYGKPATLSLAGTEGTVAVRLDGMMDQTRDDGPTELKVNYAGLPLDGTALGDGDVGAVIRGGLGRLDGTLRISGERWNGRFMLDAQGVTFEPQLGKLDERGAKIAAAALKGIKRFTATVGVEGVGDDLKLTVTSDLGRALAEGMKSAMTTEIAARRKELEQKLDAAVGPQMKELQGKSDALTKQLLAPLEKQQAAIDAQIKKATQGAIPKGLPKDLKKIFR